MLVDLAFRFQGLLVERRASIFEGLKVLSRLVEIRLYPAELIFMGLNPFPFILVVKSCTEMGTIEARLRFRAEEIRSKACCNLEAIRS